MTQPLLTVGMATYHDFDGPYFTIQHLRTTNDCKDVEFLIIDNKPDSPVSRHLKGFIEGHCQTGTAGARYIPMSKPTGTSAPRNRVFDEAQGVYVLCMDSHVITQAGALQGLLRYYTETGSRDLLTGPLMYDNLKSVSTHFNIEWRGGMWGTWGSAWQCLCKRKGRANPLLFSVVNKEHGACWVGFPNSKPVFECPACQHGLPESIPFNGHEDRLRSLGYTELGLSTEDPAFEIPGHGLGLFSCCKDNWLRFNENFSGFGGEELYIHTKYRQAGCRAMCLPFLRWCHRFYRQDQVYPLNIYDRVRNYVIGFQELALDIMPIYDHFVGQGLIKQEQWDYLICDPIGNVEWKQ